MYLQQTKLCAVTHANVTPLQMIHGLMAAFVLLSGVVQYK